MSMHYWTVTFDLGGRPIQVNVTLEKDLSEDEVRVQAVEWLHMAIDNCKAVSEKITPGGDGSIKFTLDPQTCV
jgi:hypothetical protein